MTRKPRSDSALKTLTPARQQAIADHAATHSLTDTVAWLRDDGVTTSVAALSNFLSWYHLEQRLSRNQTVVETLITDIHRQHPKLPQDQLFDIGQSFFSALAIETQDPRVWVGTQRLAQRQQQIHLDERRITLLEEQAAKAAAAEAVTTSDLTPEAKQQRMREIFGLA
jgi:hypothetical protein